MTCVHGCHKESVILEQQRNDYITHPHHEKETEHFTITWVRGCLAVEDSRRSCKLSHPKLKKRSEMFDLLRMTTSELWYGIAYDAAYVNFHAMSSSDTLCSAPLANNNNGTLLTTPLTNQDKSWNDQFHCQGRKPTFTVSEWWQLML